MLLVCGPLLAALALVDSSPAGDPSILPWSHSFQGPPIRPFVDFGKSHQGLYSVSGQRGPVPAGRGFFGEPVVALHPPHPQSLHQLDSVRRKSFQFDNYGVEPLKAMLRNRQQSRHIRPKTEALREKPQVVKTQRKEILSVKPLRKQTNVVKPLRKQALSVKPLRKPVDVPQTSQLRKESVTVEETVDIRTSDLDLRGFPWGLHPEEELAGREGLP